MSFNICGENCTNVSNRQLGCEIILDNHISNGEVKNKLCILYEEILLKHRFKKIYSSSIIENIRADEFLFGDISSEFFKCFKLNVSIQAMNMAKSRGFSNTLKQEVQSSIRSILFGDTGQMDKIIQACKEVDNYYGTDIFSSVAVRIDFLYKNGI